MNEADNNSNVTAHDPAHMTVAIIGAGLIGRGWAIVFARAGWPVKMYDLDVSALNVAREAIAAQLKTLAALELCTNTCLLYTSPSPRDATLSRMPSSA